MFDDIENRIDDPGYFVGELDARLMKAVRMTGLVCLVWAVGFVMGYVLAVI